MRLRLEQHETETDETGMSETEELRELIQAIERLKRRTSDIEVVDVCDRMIRATQRLSMTARQVPLEIQEKVLAPLPKPAGDGTTPWGEAGMSKATYYRHKKAKEILGGKGEG